MAEQPEIKGRADLIRRYGRKMAALIEGKLLNDRGKLIKAYRAAPGVFPNGPDGRAWGGEAWYRAEEWSDAGEYLGATADATKVVATEALHATKVDATKLGEGDATKVAVALVEAHLGRPAVSGAAMSSTERSRRHRAAKALIEAAAKKGE